MPKLTVLVPVYCRSEEHLAFLREMLLSVAAQTFRDFEVVLIDDGSPVDITPIVESTENLPQVRILRNDSNIRQAKSRNAGIVAAKGEFIAFMDHDDIWLPSKLQRQVEAFEANPDAGMVFCDMEIFGSHASRLTMDQSIIPDRPSFYWFVCHGNFTISASAVMVKKQAMLDIGLFDSRYSICDDFDAWLKVATIAPVVHMPEELARYRLHSSNINYSVDRLNDNKLLTALVWKYWRGAPIGMRIRLLPRLARKLIGRLYFTVRRHRTF
jgi:glycosyltransferase involved in cell wall biosynthesis